MTSSRDVFECLWVAPSRSLNQPGAIRSEKERRKLIYTCIYNSSRLWISTMAEVWAVLWPAIHSPSPSCLAAETKGSPFLYYLLSVQFLLPAKKNTTEIFFKTWHTVCTQSLIKLAWSFSWRLDTSWRVSWCFSAKSSKCFWADSHISRKCWHSSSLFASDRYNTWRDVTLSETTYQLFARLKLTQLCDVSTSNSVNFLTASNFSSRAWRSDS